MPERTVLQLAYPYAYAPITIAESLDRDARLMTAYQQLANVVILTSLVIAGCSLAVSVAAGLNDGDSAEHAAHLQWVASH